MYSIDPLLNTQVGDVWSQEGIDLFKKLCEGKLVALSTDDPRLISLIVRYLIGHL